MFYKPNYCCNCGEKIERIEWYPWTNRRFCDICETDYQIDDWIKRIFPTLFLLFGIFGLGSYLQGNSKTLNVTKTDLKGSSQNVQQPRKLKSTNLKKSAVESKHTVETNSDKQNFENLSGTKRTVTPLKQDILPDAATKNVVIATNPQNNPKESVYFCGAETKKGAPCSRKVKGGGRCWQHEGRKAMLSAKELKVGNK